MIDTLTLHGGPADGTVYRLREGDQPAEELQLSIRLPVPEGPIESLRMALIWGEVRAIHLCRHTDGGNYQYQEPDADGHADCWGAHTGPEGPVDCDGRPI